MIPSKREYFGFENGNVEKITNQKFLDLSGHILFSEQEDGNIVCSSL